MLAIMARAARAGRGRNGGTLHGPLAALFGFTTGMFLLELFLTVLAAFGVVRTTGELAPRLALLAVPAGVAVTSVAAGAANGLVERRSITLLALTVAAGTLAAEELDLHALHLHHPPNPVAWVVVHLAVLTIPVTGLLARRYAGHEQAGCCAEGKVERASYP
jgi:hypothetical protein